MVNKGRLSPDCFHCRRRKLRCDLQTNGCGQCKRGNLVCTGYRDASQMIFRDETQQTAARVARQWHQRQQQTKQTILSTAPLSVPRLQVAWDARARQAFFAHYVFGFSRSYDMLAPLYAQASADGPLAASVDAVSLAFFALQNATHKHLPPALQVLINERYLVALRSLTRALSTPDAATADATLQTALLLDLYEKMLLHQESPMPSSEPLLLPSSSTTWMSHIQGAMSLARLRGPRNTATHVARRLASRLVITLIISCAAANIRVPDSVSAFHQELSQYHPMEPKWAIMRLVIEIVNFNADTREEWHDVGTAQILARLADIEARFIAAENALPPTWHATRVSLDEASWQRLPDGLNLLEPYYDLDADHFVTQVRNVSRMLRLYINRRIQQLVCFGPQAQQAAGVIRTMCLEICSSVPQYLLPGARPENGTPFALLQTLQCYTLIKPIYTVGKVSDDPRIRTWAVAVLGYIAQNWAVRVAKEVAEILAKSPETSEWTIYAMLGGYALAA